MDPVDSLPARPLTDAELALLNRSEPVTLAVAVDDDPAPDDAADDSDDESRSVDDADPTDESASPSGSDDSDDPEPADDSGPDDGSNSTDPAASADENGSSGEPNDGADGVLVATETAVMGLALVDGEWAVVDRLSYGDGVKRYDALRSAESAVRHALR